MYASRVASANPTQGSGLMLNAIAAVFLGMTMSEQGEPRILATVIGVLILGVLDNGLTQMSVDSYVRQILVGAIIVLAVAASSISKRAPPLITLLRAPPFTTCRVFKGLPFRSRSPDSIKGLLTNTTGALLLSASCSRHSVPLRVFEGIVSCRMSSA